MKTQTVGSLNILENPDGVVIGDSHADVPIVTVEEALGVLKAVHGFVLRHRQKCSMCEVEYYLTTKYFYRRKNGKWNYRCKSCIKSVVKKLQSIGVYNSFRKARERCEDPKNNRFKYYGARGIKFLIPNYRALEQAIGPRPDGLSLDRIDCDGHYEIGNVRWATPVQQALNRRKPVKRQRDLLAA